MVALLPQPRKRSFLKSAMAGIALVALSACQPTSLTAPSTAQSGQAIDPSVPVPVALLVPKSDQGAGAVARSLENAARLAVAELGDVKIDLRVYDTAGNAGQAANMAQQAVNDGAKIILGPLFGEAANAAGVAVADDNVNVMAFSNNPSIAGGNVFILGSTFRNSANRVTDYMGRNGKKSMVIMHSRDVAGEFGRSAIQAAAAAQGIRVDETVGFDLSQESLDQAMNQVSGAVSANSSSTVMLTSDYDGALPFILDLLPGKGVSPETTTYAGITRWDVRSDAFNFPGLRNSLFAMPDQTLVSSFNSRYSAAYGASPHPLAGLAFDGIAAIGALVAEGERNALTTRGLMKPQGFQGVSGAFRFLPDGTNERGLSIATIRDRQVVILEQAPRSFAGPGLF